MRNNERKIDIDQLRKGVIFAGRGGGVRSAISIGVLRALEEAGYQETKKVLLKK